MALYSMGPLIGPVIGPISGQRRSYKKRRLIDVVEPIAGGFIAQTVGIEWVFVVISVMCGVSALIGIPLLKETYAPVIRLRKVMKSTDPEKAAMQHPTLVAAHRSKWYILWINLSRPAMLLTRSLICFVLSLYMAL